ncbi:hypothetical protein GCM10010442_52270 [Kitasatospora kifunensis]
MVRGAVEALADGAVAATSEVASARPPQRVAASFRAGLSTVSPGGAKRRRVGVRVGAAERSYYWQVSYRQVSQASTESRRNFPAVPKGISIFAPRWSVINSTPPWSEN